MKRNDIDINSKLNWSLSPWISDKVPLSEAIKFLEKKFKVDISSGHTIEKFGGRYTWWTCGFDSLKPMKAVELFEFVNEFNARFGFIEHIWVRLVEG